ncbi:Zn-dependent protease with chaperone function [Natronospira proteinivora]|uniref:Zn-dependent protease with chaperone function n=1 Tax=Natronospira proteinivora TaxID=1807133 RepID=A0ABT1GAC2_9GAMM|nr:M48 family metalloprotease [Natronospira proteinivora]MCP1727855.1 Zn-dependent protease with chaperone function [Natronospira proteinivora]
MNFFEHQDKARNQTRKLVVLFTLAVLAIIVAINLLVLGLFTYSDTETMVEQPNILSQEFLLAHLDVILLISFLTGGLIGLASLFRTVKLRSGGSVVARQLGGTPVDPDTNDPLKRRLRNVVEEVAIASGVPVPDIFILEEERGINAFAAGYSTSDAAIAVTRGTLETLNREELQGVVAHEFAHILNGDMRLNIRLMGILFGILALTIVGRILMYSSRGGGNRNAGGIVFAGLAIMLIGYIGVFFGRWIKSAVSRQREYLADASAVQFTRQPEGIGGALKKIAASQAGAKLDADTEEVGHMLFASGFASRMMATHPPLMDRIKAVDPSFKAEDLKKVHAEIQSQKQAEQAAKEEEATKAKEKQEGRRPPGKINRMMEPDNLIEQIGQPGLGQILAAALLAEAIPRPLEQAAHSRDWAREIICALLISSDADVRNRQLDSIAEHLGADSERQVRTLLEAGQNLQAEQRLPLMEMAYPQIRHRPPAELDALLTLVDKLVAADGEVSAFEYALARLLRVQLKDAQRPDRSRPGGNKQLKNHAGPVNDLLRILAHHGHEDDEAAVAALEAGMKELGLTVSETHSLRDNWHERMDQALMTLDRLRMKDKGRLVRAMVTVIQHAGETVAAEAELMRAICACLHVPLPLMEQDSGS